MAFLIGVFVGGVVVGLAWVGVSTGILKKLLGKADNKVDKI